MSQRITFYTTLVQREKLDEWLEKQKSIGSFVLAIPIVPLVNISCMPYLESEQQDETRNVTECDSEKAAVTDAQETTANEQTKPRTKRLLFVLSFVRLHLSMLSHVYWIIHFD
jgi:hypothetical protein